MLNLLWSGLFFMLLLSGCGWEGTPTRQNDITPLTSIKIVAVSPTIAANTSTRLSVTGNFSNLYTRDITDQVVWSSSSPVVADFKPADPKLVTGHTAGTAVLTATVKGVSADFTLTVSSATIKTLKLTPAAPTISKGLNTQFTATGTFSDSSVQDLTLDATWASNTPGVASVSDKGLAQSLGVGTSTISATFGGSNGTALLTVTEPLPLSLQISPATMDLTVGASNSFTVKVLYDNNTTQDVTTSSTWTSSTDSIATVSNSGVVKAVAVGSATISATYGSLPAAAAKVTVSAKTVESLALNSITHDFTVGAIGKYTVTAYYTDNSNEDVTDNKATTWAINNLAVASFIDSVNQPGEIKTVGIGTAVLTVTFGGKSQTANINVQ